MNYYEILNIPPDADKPEIKRAYFAAVKTHSPDKDPEGFKTVRLAYETLYDDKKRAEYNTYFGTSDDIRDELLAARELLRQNKYKEAAKFLTELSKKKPDTEILRLNAEALWLCKNPGKAETICKNLLSKDPQDIETLLLRAKIAASRGHTTKADGYYNDAIGIDPLHMKTYIDYMHYSLAHQQWRVSDIGLCAMRLNPDVFRDDYGLYLHCLCSSIDHSNHLLYEDDSASKDLLTCFTKFTEFFVADKNPNQLIYRNAIGAVTHVMDKIEYLPCIEKILPMLEKCKHHDIVEDDFNFIRASIAMTKLRADERIHDVLADLTGYFIDGDDNPESRLGMECYIVGELPGIRKAIRSLRDEYPEYFKLNFQFYLDALNEKKIQYLIDKYYAVYKHFQDLDYEDYDDDVFSPVEVLKPYVRETPKLGRNDPCPCGSGKKYKKCCG